MTRAPLGALATLGVCGAVVTALLVSGPAGAAGESFGITSERVGVASFDVGFCLTAGTALPATVSSSFTVSRGGTTVTSGAWWVSTPTQVLIGTDPCPAPMAVVTVTGLEPSTAYSVTAQIVLTPMVEDADGNFAADGSRSVVTLDASTSITTAAQPADVPDGEDGPSASASPSPSITTAAQPADVPDGEDGPSASAPPSPTGPGSSVAPSTPGATPTPQPSGVAPVVIARPESFPPARLAALAPAQVATIRPLTFGQLPAETVRALRPSQAAALTPGQVAAVRPGRAAALTPRAIAAIPPESLARLRPASVGALTDAQLRALTRSQVRALTPAQRAALTPDQRALLRRTL